MLYLLLIQDYHFSKRIENVLERKIRMHHYSVKFQMHAAVTYHTYGLPT